MWVDDSGEHHALSWILTGEKGSACTRKADKSERPPANLPAGKAYKKQIMLWAHPEKTGPVMRGKSLLGMQTFELKNAQHVLGFRKQDLLWAQPQNRAMRRREKILSLRTFELEDAQHVLCVAAELLAVGLVSLGTRGQIRQIPDSTCR